MSGQIQSVEDLIKAVCNDSSSWHPKEPRWFRGEPVVDTALMPTLYRPPGFLPMKTRYFKCVGQELADFTMLCRCASTQTNGYFWRDMLGFQPACLTGPRAR